MWAFMWYDRTGQNSQENVNHDIQNDFHDRLFWYKDGESHLSAASFPRNAFGMVLYFKDRYQVQIITQTLRKWRFLFKCFCESRVLGLTYCVRSCSFIIILLLSMNDMIIVPIITYCRFVVRHVITIDKHCKYYWLIIFPHASISKMDVTSLP